MRIVEKKFRENGEKLNDWTDTSLTLALLVIGSVVMIAAMTLKSKWAKAGLLVYLFAP